MVARVIRSFGVALVLLGVLALNGMARAQEPFIGEIRCFGFNFAPQGWAMANGQLLPISQNTALFSLLGTQYGGNGVTTFALPDLRGRAMIGIGQGPGLSNVVQGEDGGAETTTLSTAQLPAHTHTVTPLGSTSDATQVSPAGGVPPTKARTTLYAPGPGTVAMAPVETSSAGSNQPVATRSPYLGMNCAIALFGIFPSRP
jgi:microcystin-dependent protein